tara:strand:- start:666 stop:1058 length:393 start_codon:yes stop_codon:yes gene_type:complete
MPARTASFAVLAALLPLAAALDPHRHWDVEGSLDRVEAALNLELEHVAPLPQSGRHVEEGSELGLERPGWGKAKQVKTMVKVLRALGWQSEGGRQPVPARHQEDLGKLAIESISAADGENYEFDRGRQLD